MDELGSQPAPEGAAAAAAAGGEAAAAGDSSVGANNGPSSSVAASSSSTNTATTMINLASSSNDDGSTRIPSGGFDAIAEKPTSRDSGPLPDPASCTTAVVPSSWKRPTADAAAAASAVGPGSRSLETREVHHVTFAEPCNKYVHSDSGIVLSPDDNTDVNDVTVDGQSTELTDDDDECCDVVTSGGGQATKEEAAEEEEEDCPLRHCPAPTNALPGPPIIKLHRSRSNESQDNPFLSDGELRWKADYIIAHSTILRTYVRIADPDQLPIIDPQEESTGDTDLDPITASDVTEPRGPELTAGLTESEGLAVVSTPETPETTPQRVTTTTSSKELSSAPVRNGEAAEEPLLCRKKEENILEASPKKHAARSKKQICCVVQ